MRNQASRLAQLEHQLGAVEITLTMSDASMVCVDGHRLIDMVSELASGIVAADTRLVLSSVEDNCAEQGFGHMVAVVKVAADANQVGEVHHEKGPAQVDMRLPAGRRRRQRDM